MRGALILLAFASVLPAQRWQDTCGRSPAGLLALRQAVRDVNADSLVLLVASHPDDRYVLPAVWLRLTAGYRIAVLLATRGGGGQNSLGPESGDALERIRTLEAEACCSLAGATAWYLNRPDCGYRRTAEETFGEWGRESTLRDLVRLLRTIRPDAVLTTHHAEEAHGHDQALVELLPQAVALAGDPRWSGDGTPHPIPVFLIGGSSTLTPRAVSIDTDGLFFDQGKSLRRIAYDILRGTHLSPGPPAALDAVFAPRLEFEPVVPDSVSVAGDRPFGLPSVFDPELWPGSPARAKEIDSWLRTELPRQLALGQAPLAELAELLTELRQLHQEVDGSVADRCAGRLARRIQAIEAMMRIAAGLQIEAEVAPGTVAVGGEECAGVVRVLGTHPSPIRLRGEGLDGVGLTLTAISEPGPSGSGALLQANLRIPRSTGLDDPMHAAFTTDRFEPPVRLRFWVEVAGIEVPCELTLPLEKRAPVELSVVPRMLLLPSGRDAVQFSVGITRHSQFPIDGELEVKAPAGYAVPVDRQHVLLREQRSDLFGFQVTAPNSRTPGVDVLRIRFRSTRVVLPVHKVDVEIPSDLRIGLLRSRDDTLPSVLGVGGLGVSWSDLTDADIAAGDLSAMDTIVVDIRALRDRPAARSGFRRVLEFARAPGHRLVLFYQKDTEFHPSGEAFRGAPFEPFQVGRHRVTRPDAPVRVLVPDHPLLCYPNRILAGDWDGWEQERALYVPDVYASDYQELLELHDPGQPEERGALLYARTGEGEYVYCALAIWRQLKKLHPGAVRLLANLLTPTSKS